MNTGKKEIVRPPSKGRRRGTPSIDGRRFLYPNLLGEAAFFPEALPRGAGEERAVWALQMECFFCGQGTHAYFRVSAVSAIVQGEYICG